MDSTPNKEPKSRVILTNADRQAWWFYWRTMPPKAEYPRTCCICHKPLPDHRRYICEDC